MTNATATIGRDRYRTRIEASGHSITADEPERLGGANAGPAPYDLLLSALGACTAITLRMYADRKEWPLESLGVDLRVVRDGDTMRIERTLAPVGDLTVEQRARLADVAERTPVTLTLKSGVAIHTKLA